MTTATFEILTTPDGPFTLLVDAEGRVLASGWTDDLEHVLARVRAPLRPLSPREGTTDAGDAVRAYYRGDLAAIDSVAVRQPGTPLQERGWSALRRIRPGEPLSYAEFAAALGSPRAIRAAAAICARNAPALFVPCHRVLRANGDLGGFAWGVQVKQALLTRERAFAEHASARA